MAHSWKPSLSSEGSTPRAQFMTRIRSHHPVEEYPCGTHERIETSAFVPEHPLRVDLLGSAGKDGVRLEVGDAKVPRHTAPEDVIVGIRHAPGVGALGGYGGNRSGAVTQPHQRAGEAHGGDRNVARMARPRSG